MQKSLSMQRYRPILLDTYCLAAEAAEGAAERTRRRRGGNDVQENSFVETAL